MTTTAEVEAKLLTVLPPPLHAQTPRLAPLLIDAANGTIPAKGLLNTIKTDANLAPILYMLAGQHIIIDRAVIEFGTQEELGQLRVGEIEYEPAVKSLSVNTAGGDYSEGNIVKQDGVFISSGAIVTGPVIGVNWGTITIAPPITIEAPPAPDRPPQVVTFVGRASELGYFQQKLTEQHLAVITGMAGAGKTALASVLARQSAGHDKIFWHTFHQGEGGDVVLWKLAGFLAWYGQDGLWRLLNNARQGGSQALPPEMQLTYLIEMLQGHTYLLCFDDFHLVEDDPNIDQLLQRLCALLNSEKLSLVIISREIPGFVRVTDFLKLDGLNPVDTRILLSKRGLDLPDGIINQLHTQTGGNAQLLTLAIEALQRSNDQERLLTHLAEERDIERYLLNQVDRYLTEDERAIMAAVAVLLGFSGTRGVIEAICARGSLRRALSDLSDRHLLTITESESETKYKQHAIVQAFYYDSLSKSELQAMHRRAGIYYEVEEPAPLQAAQHFVRADEYPKAAKLITSNFWTLMKQGQVQVLGQVLERFTAQQMKVEQWISICIARAEVYTLLGESEPARSCYQEALAQLDSISDMSAASERKARVWRGLSVISARNGLGEQAEAECQSGLGLVANVDLPNLEVARLYVQLAEVLFLRSNYDDTASACHKGLTALPPEPAAPRERALLYQRLATVEGQRNKYLDAIPALKRGLDLAYQVNDPALIARILNNLGAYLNYAGQKDQALECYEECLRYREQYGDIQGRAITIMNQGGIYQERGEYDAAMKCFVESRDLSTRLNLPDRWATAVLNIGIVQFLRVQLDAAKESLLQAETSFRKLNNRNYVASCLFRLGDVALAQHDPAIAKSYGEQSLVLAQEVGSAAYQFSALRVIFEALLAQGKLDEAASYLEQGERLQRQIDEPSYQVRILIAFARLELAQKQYSKALMDAQKALALASEHEFPYLVEMAKALCTLISDAAV